MDQHAPIVVRGGIVVRAVHPSEVVSVLAALDRAEAAAGGAPLVDESERRRLDVAASLPDDAGRPLLAPAGSPSRAEPDAPAWWPVAAFRGAATVGYAAVVRRAAAGASAGAPGRGDAAALTADPARAVLGALLAAVRHVAVDAELGELDIWVRQAGERDADVAAVEGFEVARRLGVLGRDLDDLPEPVAPTDHTIRSYNPDADDAGVVDVLASAYEGTPEAGWDLVQFQERREYEWFCADDLLVAVDDRDGRINGLHWLKRRGPVSGEVYNLAVHPRAQGKQLGPALLAAGLHHLLAIGCDEVVLWVDRANERAVALYEGQGFVTRWDDLAFHAAFD